MANYCMNDIVLYSKRKKPLIRPHNQLKHLSKEDSYSYPIHRLLSSLEASYLVDDLDDLRHYILDFDSIDKKNDTYYFHLYTEAAWSPHIEDIDILLSLNEFKSISYVYQAEEPGFEIYINSDSKREFLNNSYLFYYYCGDDDEDAYYSDLNDLIDYVDKHFLNALITPWDTPQIIIDKLNTSMVDSMCNYGFYIHEFYAPDTVQAV